MSMGMHAAVQVFICDEWFDCRPMVMEKNGVVYDFTDSICYAARDFNEIFSDRELNSPWPRELTQRWEETINWDDDSDSPAGYFGNSTIYLQDVKDEYERIFQKIAAHEADEEGFYESKEEGEALKSWYQAVERLARPYLDARWESWKPRKVRVLVWWDC